jgi:hypothetical protein
MNASKSVTATFTTKPVLSVEKAGDGAGTVTSSPTGTDCGLDCNEPYDADNSVTLTASSDPPVVFVGWSGGDCTGTAPCTVTIGSNMTVTAEFDDPTTHQCVIDGRVDLR